MKKTSITTTAPQLKFEFSEVKKEQPKEVKVISLTKIQSNELNAKILNRKRPSL